jgi:hypothetical protein
VPPKKKAAPRKKKAAPPGLLSCVANWVISPDLQRPAPAEFSAALRFHGMDVHGPITAGSMPHGLGVPEDMRWPVGSTLRVCFLDGPLQYKQKVEDIATEWVTKAKANLTFRFGASAGASDVRVTFPGTNSFWSRLGREAEQHQGQPTVNLGFQAGTPPDEFHRLILHEFGHALGLQHEHMNPRGPIRWNKAAAIAYYSRLLPGLSPDAVWAQLVGLPNSSRYLITAFDARSVMLYSIPEQVVEPGSWRPEFANNNTELSDGDTAIIRQMYPGAAGTTDDGGEVELTVDGDPKRDSIDADGEADRYVFKVKTEDAYEIITKGAAIVRVTLTDAAGAVVGAPKDAISAESGAYLSPWLRPGTYHLEVIASPFSPFSRGEYTVQVRRYR